MNTEISAVRVDVPLRHGAVLLFCVLESDWRYDPWWGGFFEFLLSKLPEEADWTPEVDGRRVSRRVLDDGEVTGLLGEMRRAPAKEVAEHSSLRRSLAHLPARHGPCALVFFRDAPTS